jgi:hypothetical protein
MGNYATKHPVEDQADRIDVSRRAKVFIGRSLLGRHKSVSANYRVLRSIHSPDFMFDSARDPEIHDPDVDTLQSIKTEWPGANVYIAIRMYHDIVWLEVAMN